MHSQVCNYVQVNHKQLLLLPTRPAAAAPASVGAAAVH
jgi:hypothetical protein